VNIKPRLPAFYLKYCDRYNSLYLNNLRQGNPNAGKLQASCHPVGPLSSNSILGKVIATLSFFPSHQHRAKKVLT
jgi:hypothetical protein